MLIAPFGGVEDLVGRPCALRCVAGRHHKGQGAHGGCIEARGDLGSAFPQHQGPLQAARASKGKPQQRKSAHTRGYCQKSLLVRSTGQPPESTRIYKIIDEEILFLHITNVDMLNEGLRQDSQ